MADPPPEASASCRPIPYTNSLCSPAHGKPVPLVSAHPVHRKPALARPRKASAFRVSVCHTFRPSPCPRRFPTCLVHPAFRSRPFPPLSSFFRCSMHAHSPRRLLVRLRKAPAMVDPPPEGALEAVPSHPVRSLPPGRSHSSPRPESLLAQGPPLASATSSGSYTGCTAH